MTLTEGKAYIIKTAPGRRAVARYLGERVLEGYRLRSSNKTYPTRRHYRFLNLESGREVELKSTQRVLLEV